MNNVPSMVQLENAAPAQGVFEQAIDWHAIDHPAVINEEELFYLLAMASFIKSATQLHVHDIVKSLSADAEIVDWLEQHWLQEELQHGRTLARYVQAVWPQFDWASVYAFFFDEFAINHQDESFASSRSLEMVSCCAVEMANAGCYIALSEMTQEPILRSLARRISDDEVRHYQNFYRYFIRYRELENTSRFQVLQTIWRRLMFLYTDDNVIAMKHVYGACHPSESYKLRTFRQMQKRCRRQTARFFPRKMCAEMLQKPLGLGLRFRHMTAPILGRVTQRFVS
jgi:hypothetical protein